MAKTAEQVRAKMEERAATAGKYLRDGMANAPDPIDVLLKNPEQSQQKMLRGVQEAARKGSYIAGLRRAKERNAWGDSLERAGAHYEEAAPRMVDNAMKTYETRMAAIERAKAKVANMPRGTTAERIAYAAAYQKAASEEFASAFGRKT